MPEILKPRNYLRGESTFTVDAPPDWWLREMALFDPLLVIFPSAKAPTFILARRAQYSAGETLHDAKDKETGKPIPQNPDTVFMRKHRLVRVCELLPGVLWDQRVFQKLAAHDIHRLGGPKKVADILDARDENDRAKIDRDQTDELVARSREAYRGYKYRVGERMSLAKSSGRGTLVKKPVSVQVRTPTPAGPAA